MIKAEQDPPISQQVGAQSRQTARLWNEKALFKRELTEELLRCWFVPRNFLKKVKLRLLS